MTPTRRLLVRAALTSCRCVRVFSRLLPTRVVLAIGSLMGRVVGHFCAKDERLSFAQLRYVFPNGLQGGGVPRSEWSDAEIAAEDQKLHSIAKESFRHMGENVAELLLWERFFDAPTKKGEPSRRLRRDVGNGILTSGEDLFEELKRKKTGALGLSAHFGSFELLAAYLANNGLPCSVIGRAPNYVALEKAVRHFREAYGVSVIWADTPEAPRQIVQAIRSGRIICTLIDQDTKFKSEFSPFFGLEAASPISPIQIAIRYELPIFTSFIRRIGTMKHEVTTRLVPYSPEDTLAPKKVLDVFNERLEVMIRNDPAQYLWWHRRWRRRPGTDYNESPHLLPSSRQYIAWLEALSANENPAV